MRRPIMTSPTQLRSLEGQQYLVLRPTGTVASEFRLLQQDVLAGLDAPVTFPHTEHITLRGFAEPHRREELASLVRTWAAGQGPIVATADAVDTFPSPWQIVILRLARTASLVAAYATLTDLLVDTDFRRLDELDLEDWTFHLSLVYGRALDDVSWGQLVGAARRPLPHLPTETISEAEFVWYQNGVEHAEIIPLGPGLGAGAPVSGE